MCIDVEFHIVNADCHQSLLLDRQPTINFADTFSIFREKLL